MVLDQKLWFCKITYTMKLNWLRPNFWFFNSKIPKCTDMHWLPRSEFDGRRHNNFKDSPDPSHFIFEIIVGKSRIRHRTVLDFEWEIISLSPQNRLNMPWLKFRVVLCRIRLFPTLISKNKLATLKPRTRIASPYQ